MDCANIDYSNIETFKLRHGFYYVESLDSGESVEIRLDSFGTAPSPVSGATYTVDSSAARFMHEIEIDISNFGTWTPNPQARVTGGTNGAEIQGSHTVEIVGVIGE